MTPGAVKVETLGSFVWLDEAAGQYLRTPKEEAPREKAEWSDERAGRLQDGVWHEMITWSIDRHPAHSGRTWPCCRSCPGLMIDVVDPETGPKTLWFPNAEVVR